MADIVGEETVDLGLINTNDDSAVFLSASEPLDRRAGIPSLSFSSPSSPDLTERQSRSKPARLSLHHLSRSQSVPRSYHKSPIGETASSSLDTSPLEPDVVNRLRRWILCTLIVNFDLDLGPVVDGVFPSFPLSASEKENICFSSFPDSFRYDEGCEAHAFRIRESLPEKDNDKFDHGLRQCFSSQDGFLYGFSYFSRRKNKSSLRGYDQRSVVILTRHPWPALYTELVNRLGPMFLAHGGPMLESACHNIASWPPPDPVETLELGFLGSVLNVELPGNVDQQQTTETPSFRGKFDPKLHILASVAPLSPSPLNLFAASISHIWSIWEAILLCEPLLIFGQSSAMTSQAVWWLLDILRPIPFAGDFRPYFTIHDKDYHMLVNKNYPKAGLLLGVTNPLFENMCKHWPHKLSLGREAEHPKRTGLVKSPVIAGIPPGWQTKNHNRYISKDRELLRRLELSIKKGGTIDADGHSSLLLRRHFTTRSVQFLVPLNRYLNTLIPSPSSTSTTSLSSPSALYSLRVLKPFNRDHFFASLKAHGSPLPFRSTAKQKEFYERWLRSPAFGLWMARQEETVNNFLQKPA